MSPLGPSRLNPLDPGSYPVIDPSKVLAAIVRVQSCFINESGPRAAFEGLLADLLELAESDYGFIGEVLNDDSGAPYLKTLALSNIAWNDTSKKMYEENLASGLEFKNLETLFGAVITTSEIVISNSPTTDPRRGGLPLGHPALHKFLGMPIIFQGRLVGVVGVANRLDGYSEEFAHAFAPLLATVGQLLDARTREIQRSASETVLNRALLQLEAAERIAGFASWNFSKKTGKLTWSPGAYRLLEYQEGHLEPSWESMYRIIHPDDMVRVMAASVKSRTSSESIEIEHRVVTATGRILYVIARAEPQYDANKELVAIIGSMLDITARRKAERAEQRANRTLIQASEIALMGTWEKDLKSGALVWSDTMCRLYRLPIDQKPDTIDAARRFIHPDDFGAVGVPEERILNRELDPKVRYKVIRYDGVERIFESTWEVLSDESGEPNRAVGVTLDVTDSVKALQAVEESNYRLALALSSTGLGMWSMDVEKGLFTTDATISQIFRMGNDPITYSLSDWNARIHPGDLDQVGEAIRRCVSGIEDPVKWRLRVRSGDNQWVHCEVVAKVHQRDREGRVQRLIGTTKDITRDVLEAEERERITRQMEHAQKLESLGVLAGGIAHDFNNLLAGMLGYASLALKALEPDHPATERVRRVQESAERAAELTKQMLAYSGKGRFVVEMIDLTNLVEGMVKLLEISISKSALLRLNLNEDLPNVEADAAQLRQVVMNLITNASDAIGSRSGVITITTGVMYADAAYLRGSYADASVAEGYFTFVEVADTGVGMDRETIAKIFDPFFTTKFTGRGLGLSAVLGIVRGHSGAIRIHSEPQRGTTFRVLFPSKGKRTPKRPTGRIRDLTRLEGIKALVVDDEETIRSVTSMMLEEEGATVLTAVDGKDAVDVFKVHGQDIDFVLLDMTMPRMDGESAFRELRRLDPYVRVILCSGYNEQDATNRFAGKGLAGFIQKPFRFEDLIKVVREIVQTQPDIDPAPFDAA